MNQKTINVVLLSEDEEKDILRFDINDKIVDINLNDPTCQQSLKCVFNDLLCELLKNDIILSFNTQEGYHREMYKEVCKELITDIGRELDGIKEELRTEICIQSSPIGL